MSIGSVLEWIDDYSSLIFIDRPIVGYSWLLMRRGFDFYLFADSESLGKGILLDVLNKIIFEVTQRDLRLDVHNRLRFSDEVTQGEQTLQLTLGYAASVDGDWTVSMLDKDVPVVFQ